MNYNRDDETDESYNWPQCYFGKQGHHQKSDSFISLKMGHSMSKWSEAEGDLINTQPMEQSKEIPNGMFLIVQDKIIKSDTFDIQIIRQLKHLEN